MARPPAKELTERELEVMHIYWQQDTITAADARDRLESAGRNLAYTTVATLCRILCDKGFLTQVNKERPFFYRAREPFQKVSKRLVSDVVQRVFRGSRTQLLLTMLQDRKLTTQERELLQSVLEENGGAV
jgi:predicted transcriptional regulator